VRRDIQDPLLGGGRALKKHPVGVFSEGASLQGRLVVGSGVGKKDTRRTTA
jgi:hypothetical protein